MMGVYETTTIYLNPERKRVLNEVLKSEGIEKGRPSQAVYILIDRFAAELAEEEHEKER